MLIPFLIMFREGLEAALIVGIIASYLERSGRHGWMPLVWIGIAGAALLSLGLGLVLDLLRAEFPQKQQELFEAAVGLVAAVLLTAMVFWMRRAARAARAELHGRLDLALASGDGSGSGRGFALVLTVFLAVTREGLETVFFLLAAFGQARDATVAAPLGAVLGLLAAAAAGYGFYRGSLRLDLARFFRWTGAFILLVSAGLLAGSLRALHEAGLWNALQGVAFDLSGVLPTDGVVGAVLAGLLGYSDAPTVGEVSVYALFLLATLPAFLGGGGGSHRATSAGSGA